MNRRDLAREHHNRMLDEYYKYTDFSFGTSTVYSGIGQTTPEVIIENTDCVSAAQNLGEEVTILNFASYKHPGGGFIYGSFAQEESLCHESNLYEILSSKEFENYYEYNKSHINRGLYMNRAIFTPEVMFERNDNIFFYNVLTCAAPNYKVAISNGIKHDEIVETYRQRLKFIYNILVKQMQQTLVAGLWGCGVFGFPKDVAIELFKEEALIDTILAIPN